MSTDGIGRGTRSTPTTSTRPTGAAAPSAPLPATDALTAAAQPLDTLVRPSRPRLPVPGAALPPPGSPFAQGRDGYGVFDPKSGEIIVGREVGTTVRDGVDLPGTTFDTLGHLLASPVANEDVSFQVSGAAINPRGETDRAGRETLSGHDLRAAVAKLDPKRGGTFEVGISAENSGSSMARMLMLPRDYDGPIFISDIDDTLRETHVSDLVKGKDMPEVPGARELLGAVAGLNIPICYLSAGPAQLHPVNADFLSRFPPGILLDNENLSLKNLHPDNAKQAKMQGDYKTQVLQKMRQMYPKAQFFGLGDNKFGDAIAYEAVGARAFIHNVRATQTNQPAGFKGVLSDDYTFEFQTALLRELGGAILRSKSLEGDPTLPPLTPTQLEAPPAAPRHTFWDKLERAYELGTTLLRGLPEALATKWKDFAEGAQGALRLAKSMSDLQLCRLPADAQAELAKDLLEPHHLDEVIEDVTQANLRYEQFLRVLTAHGASPGAVDRVLSRIPFDVASRLEGAAKARFLELRKTHPAPRGDWKSFLTYLDQATDTRSRPGTVIEPLIDGHIAYPRMMQAISEAQSSVTISTYAFHSDQAGWDFARALADAAKRGVDTRVIYDPIGSKHSNGSVTNPDLYDFMRRAGVKVIAQQPGPLANHLNHRKITVVDGRMAFTGGMNIGNEYRNTWHDLHAQVLGPAVEDLQALFMTQWQANGGTIDEAARERLLVKIEPIAGGSDTRVIGHVGLGDQNLKLGYLRAIDTAEKTIDIATPYLTDLDVVAKLRAAAERGVRVRLVLPKVNDSKLVQMTERALYDDLRTSGVHIYEYKGAPMAHQKVAVFDEKISTVGSSNLDGRSLRNNDEDNLWVDDPKLSHDLTRDLFEADIKQSEEILEYKPGIFHFVMGEVLLKFTNLL